jgi:hypothetical protein
MAAMSIRSSFSLRCVHWLVLYALSRNITIMGENKWSPDFESEEGSLVWIVSRSVPTWNTGTYKGHVKRPVMYVDRTERNEHSKITKNWAGIS